MSIGKVPNAEQLAAKVAARNAATLNRDIHPEVLPFVLADPDTQPVTKIVPGETTKVLSGNPATEGTKFDAGNGVVGITNADSKNGRFGFLKTLNTPREVIVQLVHRPKKPQAPTQANETHGHTEVEFTERYYKLVRGLKRFVLGALVASEIVGLTAGYLFLLPNFIKKTEEAIYGAKVNMHKLESNWKSFTTGVQPPSAGEKWWEEKPETGKPSAPKLQYTKKEFIVRPIKQNPDGSFEYSSDTIGIPKGAIDMGRTTDKDGTIHYYYR